MVLRWVLSNVMETLRLSAKGRGYGLDICESRLLHLVWEDDTWLVAKPPADLNAMVEE